MSQKKDIIRHTNRSIDRILCIILLAGLVGEMLYYNTQVSTLSNDRDALMNYQNQLEAWLSGNQTQLAQVTLDFQSQIDDLTTQIAQLQGQVNLLQSIVNLDEQRNILNQHTMSQGPSEQSIVVSFQANYAGYVQISLTSTTDTAYIALHYQYQGHLFSFVEWVGTFGEAYFCVLPSNATMYIGNRNESSGANYTITATYHF
jgi:TolA-binding protein